MASSKFVAVFVAALAVLLSMAAAQVPPPPPPPPPATPPAPSSGSNNTTCDPLQLRVCSNLLRGLLRGLLPGGGGNGTNDQCCPLLGGLVGLDAAVCLCTALRANVLGIVNLNVPLGLRLLLGQCGSSVPAGFTCPPA